MAPARQKEKLKVAMASGTARAKLAQRQKDEATTTLLI